MGISEQVLSIFQIFVGFMQRVGLTEMHDDRSSSLEIAKAGLLGKRGGQAEDCPPVSRFGKAVDIYALLSLS